MVKYIAIPEGQPPERFHGLARIMADEVRGIVAKSLDRPYFATTLDLQDESGRYLSVDICNGDYGRRANVLTLRVDGQNRRIAAEESELLPDRSLDRAVDFMTLMFP